MERQRMRTVLSLLMANEATASQTADALRDPDSSSSVYLLRKAARLAGLSLTADECAELLKAYIASQG